MLILVIKFFMSLGSVPPTNWIMFAKQTVIVLVAAVALPAVLMAMFLTRKPAQTLKLRVCSVPVACAAILAACFLHPAATWLTNLVMEIYPPSGDLALLEQLMSAIFADAPGFWAILLVLALAPAILEELAFRGFILSGMQSVGNSLKAIVITSLFFGLAHSILQQSIITFFLGCILGFIAVRTKSLIPCILYHMTHNSISTAMSFATAESLQTYPVWKFLLQSTESGSFEYRLLPAILMTIAGCLLLLWFWKYDSVAAEERESRRDLSYGLDTGSVKAAAK